ncbi:MAG: malonyl-ACP O-methyltransferase BioC [Pantoea sp. Brub]|nr:malonyl-ACP O-methyltransferase BioC [Pantoea sp. Brub]
MMLQINKQAIAKAFGRSAINYDYYSKLQRITGNFLLKLVPSRSCLGKLLLDAGCGTGWYSRIWRNYGKIVVALDISKEMLQQAKNNKSANYYLLGDIDFLPLANSSIDIIWSNLVVQWSRDLRSVINQFTKILKPCGCLLFSTLSSGSLKEIHLAWSYVDNVSHVNTFLSKNEIISICNDNNLIHKSKIITMHYPNIISAMRSIKGTGATHLHNGRKNIVLTRNRLSQLETYWPRDKKGFRLTYNLIYGVTRF